MPDTYKVSCVDLYISAWEGFLLNILQTKTQVLRISSWAKFGDLAWTWRAELSLVGAYSYVPKEIDG